MNISLSALLILLLTLVGCNSNPYPKDGTLQVQAPEAQRAVEPAFAFPSDEAFEFTEGQEAGYSIKAKVPVGEPVLSFEDLPSGVAYDAKTGKIVWKPGFDAANDPKDPFIRQKYYRVKVLIGSSTDPTSKIVRFVTLVVKDKPRNFALDMLDTVTVKEGETKKFTLKITDEDFPGAVHSISTTDVIPGLVITQDPKNPLIYNLEYSPSYDSVQLSASGSCTVPAYCSRNATTTVQVVSPNGTTVKKALNLIAEDVRLLPEVFIPTSLNSYGDTFFEFSVEDPNQEVKPTVKLVNSLRYGTATIAYRDKFAAGSAKNNWSQTVQVSWNNVKGDAVGQDTLFQFQICNVKKKDDFSSCVVKTVSVHVSVYQKNLPDIKRASWPANEIRYVKEGQSVSFDVAIAPKAATDPIADVYVLPGKLSREVYWENNILNIAGMSAGVKTVSLVVTTQSGGKVSDLFQYEVMPKDWNQTIMFSSSSYDSEVSGLKPTINFEMIDMTTEGGVPSRLLELRRNLVVTSNVMASLDDQDKQLIDSTLPKVKDVFIFGGKAFNATGALLAELKSYGVNVIEQLNPKTAGLDLSKFSLQFGLPASTAFESKLKYDYYTSDFKLPTVVSLSPSSKCTRLISLYQPGSVSDYTVGISCDRKNGGKIYFIGLSIDDIDFAQDTDKTSVVNWLKAELEN